MKEPLNELYATKMYNCYIIYFYAISFNGTQDLHFPKNFGIIVTTVHPSKLWSQRKIYQYYVYCLPNFVRFHVVESKVELPQEFWEKQNSRAPYWAMHAQIASLLFLMICILYTNFWAISYSRNQNQRIPNISEKVKL